MNESAKHILKIARKWGKILGIVFLSLWAVVIIVLQLVLTESFLTEAARKYIPEFVKGARVEFRHINASAIRSFPYLRVNIDSVAVVYAHDKYAAYDSLSRIDNILSGLGRSTEADTLVTFNRLSVAVNYFSLIKGTVNIHDVSADGMKVFARQFGDLDANWNIFGPSEEDAEEEEEDGELPDIVLRNLGFSGNTLIVYENAADTLFAAVGMKNFRFGGRIAVNNPFRSRIGLRLDSLFVAGRTSSDTLAMGLNYLKIKPRGRFHRIDLDGGTFVSLSDGTRISLPVGLDVALRLPSGDLSRFMFKDLHGRAASVEVYGKGDVSLRGDTTGLDLDLSVPELDVARLLEDYSPVIGPDAAKVRTDAVVKAALSVSGIYVSGSDALPPLKASVDIPRSGISVEGIGDAGHLQGYMTASTDSLGRLGGKISGLDLELAGLSLAGSASGEDVTGADPLLNMDLKAQADLDRLSRFLPRGTDASGKVDAAVKGSARLSSLNISNFAGADLSGSLNTKGISYSDSTLTAFVGRTSIVLDKAEARRRGEVGKVLTLGGGIDTLSVDMLPASCLRASGIGLSARNADMVKSVDGDEYRPLVAGLDIKRLSFVGEDSLRVFLRGSENSVRISRKMSAGKKAPLLGISSSFERIGLRQGKGRVGLGGLSMDFSAFKVPVAMDNRRQKMLDSLQKVWPGVPRDSLMRKYMRRRGLRKLPDYLQDKSFREKDIHIDLGESANKFMKEWTLGGKARLEGAMLAAPSFPLRNRLSSLGLYFDNNSITLDSLNLRSGRSVLAAKGSVTGLRAVLGRSPRPLDVKIEAVSESLNFNEIFAALEKGEKYSSGFSLDSGDDDSDSAYMDAIAIDSTALDAPGDYPLIVIPSNINLNLSLKGRNLRYSTLDVDGYSAEIAMKERTLQLRNTRASSNMGNIAVEGFYSTRTRDDISVGFDLGFSDVTAEKVVTMFPAMDTIMPLLKTFKGVVNCNIAATCALDTNMNVSMPSIAGVMKIRGDSLELEQNSAVRKITRLLLFKDKKKAVIDSMSVMGVISDNQLEVFPFMLSVDRYRLALGGIQNFDTGFHYHLSVLKSPIPFKFGINIKGSPDNWKWRLGGAKYKKINTPMYSQRIDTMHLNLLESIHNIFEKGVQAAVEDNRRAADSASARSRGIIDISVSASDTLSGGEMKQMDSLLYRHDHPDSLSVADSALVSAVFPRRLAPSYSFPLRSLAIIPEKAYLCKPFRTQIVAASQGYLRRRAHVTAFRKASRVC